MKFLENVNLAPFSYYKIGSTSRWYCAPESIEDLKLITDFINKNNLGYFILGAGSNILLPDEPINGLVIHTSKLNQNFSVNELILTVGSSCTVIQVLRFCMANGFSGFEFAVGIPGNIGGLITMNGGTHTGEASDQITEVTIYNLKTGQIKTYTKLDLKFKYRSELFLDRFDLITEAKFKISKSIPESVQNKIQDLMTRRKNSQPTDKPSCGSVFKNPSTEKKAWQLIDDCGLRGKKIGDAQISEKHSNFIVNLGNAKSDDVKKLIELIKKTVFEKFKIQIEEEVKIVTNQTLKYF